MKGKYSRIISILLAMMMVMTSLSIVFAVDEVAGAPEEDPVVTEQVTDEVVGEPAEQPSEEVIVEEPSAPADEEVPAVVEEEAVEQEDAVVDSYDALGASAEGTVTVTVNYIYDNSVKDKTKAGKKAAEPVTQVITLEKDEEGNYKDGTFSIASPAIKGYAPDKAKVEGTVKVAEGTVKVLDGAGKEVGSTVTVTYKGVATGPVTNLKLHPTYNAILLSWNKVADAKQYVIMRSLSQNSGFTELERINNTGAATYWYKDKKANGTEGDFSLARRYYYRVYAISQSNMWSKGIWINGIAVRPMYEKITFKSSCTLGGHGGKNQSHTFKAGQTVVAQGFGGGKYRFWYKGTYHYANYVRVRNCRADYNYNSKSKKADGNWSKQAYAAADKTCAATNFGGIKCYSKVTAENFVNNSGKGSKTKYLIWVSTVQQHLYVFQGSKGKWKLIKDWECATGAAGSPTPTGFDKQIERKVRSRHGVSYWSPFQTWNSIHGKLSSWAMGGPASNGCVRNFDSNAKWIYYNCDPGTGLIVY